MIICTAISIFGYMTANAQEIIDKIDRTNSKVNKAGSTADRTKKTGEKIIGLFAKRKEGNTAASETKTTIKITGTTLTTLKKINEKVENSKSVISTKMKFSSSSSSITVQHTGNTDDLLTILQKSAPDIFIEKNIESFDDGEILLKIK